jgi:hypothetical protein
MQPFASVQLLRRSVVLALVLCAAVPVVHARQAVEAQSAPAAPAAPIDAESTRQALMQILERHPPAVGRVLKLDPSLMRNESYLATYPALQEFLAAHPEVPVNAPYYLERVRSVNETWTPPSPELRVAENTLQAMAVLTGMAFVIFAVFWLIRTAVEQRRWSRLSKIQAEVHTKLMDRFSSNDELLAYVQMPAGRRFLESGPSPLQEASPAIGAPFTRILWSVQVGAVLLVTGMGLLFLSGRALPALRELFYILGCLATALGAGFAVSAVAAYLLSRRLGLLERSAPDHA